MHCLLWLLMLAVVDVGVAEPTPLAPTALVSSTDGKMLYVACEADDRILCLDTERRRVSGSMTMPGPPSGLALSPDGETLYVTCGAAESRVCVIDLLKQKISESIPAGHTAMAPVLSPDGKFLYVCNRFNDDVSVINLASRKELRRIAVRREPVAADITKDARYLLVTNHLPNGGADVKYVAAVVSVIDMSAGKVVKELHLPNGSGSLNDLRVSPDGKYAVVTHIIGRFNRVPTHVTEGWIHVNAMTIIDLASMEIRNTVLLDEPYKGAANPWGVAWSADGATVFVAHAGTHEVSAIDFRKLLAGTPALPAEFYAQADRADDVPFLPGPRLRIKLPHGDLGPRAVIAVGHTVYTANYFSDTLSAIDVGAAHLKPQSIALGPKPALDIVRKGDFYFHDAGICFEGWQSCSSCHPGDARADGLNWDLLNDGIGNPKNTKSLLLAHQTPPATWLGVRENAETAVRAGVEHINFMVEPEEVPAAIDAYLKSLKPVPSPHLVNGRLSAAAERGKGIFKSAGCADCHPPPLFTDLESHNVGTSSGVDAGKEFYTPTLVEVWRTAPYLHDGRAVTLHDLFTPPDGKRGHGGSSSLSHKERNDLIEYILSQ